MKELNALKKYCGINDKMLDLIEKTELEISGFLRETEKTSAVNSLKVLNAFHKHNISEAHFVPTTGYGYDDLGRETLDKVYADVFGAEAALVRHNIVSGTHAISLCLYGVLRPGDTLVAVTGKPYDTLEEVIGIRGEKGNGSLKDFGVNYKQVDLINGKVDFEGIKNAIDSSCKAVEIQRSKGYGWRKSFTISDIEEIISFVKSIRSDIICIVDNCYGEFVEEKEPTDVGADLVVGSLIKNPGGGLARSGGYIAGTKKCVDLVANRFTCPGQGSEGGATLGETRHMFQGLFLAPHTVCQAIKSAALCGALCENLGYKVIPEKGEMRTDIIQAIQLGSEEKMIKFCRGIQKGSPIDSFVVPSPSEMPGYESKVIMAAGAFTQGSSIEISADGPIREPFTVYYQGGLTYETAKAAIAIAINNIME